MPVRSPKPSFRHVSYSRVLASVVVLPSLSATFAATTLRENAIAFSKVMMPLALWSASSTRAVPPSRRRVPVSRNFDLMVTVPLPSAAVAVSILNTEPGS